ncbi:MAG: hypothetical protein ACREKH_15615 [Candidatus Rokuibacteriota bacterium]
MRRLVGLAVLTGLAAVAFHRLENRPRVNAPERNCAKHPGNRCHPRCRR